MKKPWDGEPLTMTVKQETADRLITKHEWRQIARRESYAHEECAALRRAHEEIDALRTELRARDAPPHPTEFEPGDPNTGRICLVCGHNVPQGCRYVHAAWCELRYPRGKQ